MNLLKKLFPKRVESSEKKSLSKYYTSIKDLPVWDFWQVHETKDLTHILIDKKQTLCENAADALRQIKKEFIELMGIREKYKKYLRLDSSIQYGYNKQLLTGDRSTTLILKTMEKRLADMFADEKQSNYFQELNHMEKNLHRRIDVRTESTFNFYSQLKSLMEWQNQRK